MFFYVMTKNLNWEISTKNLVTFRKQDEVYNIIIIIIILILLKNRIFMGEGYMKKHFWGEGD